MRIYASPEFRRLFREELKTNRSFHGDWTMVWVNDVQRADFKPLIGKSLAEIAAEQGKDALDLFIDLPLADNLALEYTTVRFGVPEEYLADPRTLIGLSDGGAHVAALCNAGYPTEMMGDLVRDRGLLSLEIAVKRVTSEPADFFGIRNRGRLLPGLAADLALFDMKTVGSNSARPQPVFDLPGGGRRMVVPARGMEYTIVNGKVLYDHQKHTGVMPGRVLRGGA
jgi:N-acyl-D-amino-acid deacylase